MDSIDLATQFRYDVDDRVAPYLWSTVEVLDYIDDAQKMFCRLTGGIGDMSSDITALNYVAGDTQVTVSPLVLKIRSAYDNTTGAPLEVVNVEDMAARGWRFDGTEAVLRALIVGIEPNTAWLYPVPILDGTARIAIERLPLLTIDDLDITLEVPAQHKAGLLLWVRARAYGKQDADTFDAKRSENFAGQFRAYCADAKAEKDRARHKPRTVAYGGL